MRINRKTESTIRNPRKTHVNCPALGGQHTAPVGDSTLHHVCPASFSVALQRAAERFDIDGAGDCEPSAVPFLTIDCSAPAARGGEQTDN